VNQRHKAKLVDHRKPEPTIW